MSSIGEGSSPSTTKPSIGRSPSSRSSNCSNLHVGTGMGCAVDWPGLRCNTQSIELAGCSTMNAPSSSLETLTILGVVLGEGEGISSSKGNC